MTDTREDLWAQVQESLTMHVRLASIVPGDITAELRALNTNRDQVVALYAAALVTLIERGGQITPAPALPTTGQVLWRWVLSLFRTRPAPTGLDLVDGMIRDEVAIHWDQAREWYDRTTASAHPDPTGVTFIALNLYLGPRVPERDQAVNLLGAALLACTAVWEG